MLGRLVVVPLLPPPVESSGPTEEGRLEDGGLKGSVSTPPAAELGAPIWSAAAGNASAARALARIRDLRILLT